MVPETITRFATYQVCHMVPTVREKQIPYTVCRMVPTTCVKRIPYTVCKPVHYTQTIQCPRCVEVRALHRHPLRPPLRVQASPGHGLLPSSLLQRPLPELLDRG